MEKKNSKEGFKSGILSVIKYAFATVMFGIFVLLVIATYVAAK